MAAVLACGPEACLSHVDAAALHGLQRPAGRLIHVTAPTGRSLPGIRCHVPRAPVRAVVVDGIPATPMERTVLDQAPRLSQQRLRSTLEALQRRGDFDYNRFTALLQTANGHRGTGKLKRALAALTDEPPWLQSDMERDFLERVRAAGLPEPSANVMVDGVLVDFYWADQKLIVEVDSYGFITGASERSRMTVAGMPSIRWLASRTFRPTYERIKRGGRDAVIRDLSALLGAEPRGPSGL